jgi:cell division protein FtsW (lipid II flippase)/cell division protein FtsI/penicillin-binding protein 2
MRVIQTAPSRQWGLPSRPASLDRPAARIERLGLGATSLVLLLGFGLTYAGQSPAVTSCTDNRDSADGGDGAGGAAPGPAACAVNLTALAGAGGLVPVLPPFGGPVEQAAVARALWDRLDPESGAPPIQHVGGLAAVTVPAGDVAADPRLTVLNERLQSRPGAAGVPALSGADLAALKPGVVVRTPGDYRRVIVASLALFMISFWLAHLVRAWRGTTGDGLLLPVVHLLTGLGLMVMMAIRDPLRDMVIASTVTGGIAAGCAIWIAASVLDFEHPRLRRAVLLPLSGAVLLALALLMFGGGPAGSGARVNLAGVQPVEAIRLLVAFALAAYFARRWPFLRELSDGVGPTRQVRRHLRLPRWKDVRPLAITIGTLLLFFFLQKDLGPALVLSCVFLGLYGLARARVALVLCGIGALIAGFAAGYLSGFPGTVTRRVAIWLDPWQNALPGGDQIAHALWALSTGGVWGVGPGIGDPQLVPAGHTDLVLAAVGEELGFVGVIAVLALFGLLIWRMLRIALRAPGDYTAFLAAALALGLAVQAIVITGGMLGLLPLAGVVTPFLSYGRSAMLSNFAAVAVCAAIAVRLGAKRQAFVKPMRAIRWTLAAAGIVLAARAGLVQVVRADTVAAQANLTEQGDGGLRFQYNPRLVAAGSRIIRGTIYDRQGVPLATSRTGELDRFAAELSGAGVHALCRTGGRCYPLGGLAFHVLGNADRQINWAARNTSYVEQDFDAHLKGFDDRPRTIAVRHPRNGRVVMAVRRDYAELLPLVRHKGNPDHDAVQRILARDRDLHLSLDAGLQVKTAEALRRRALEAGADRGAAIVIDPASGELLASASYPWPEEYELHHAPSSIAPDRLLDRARYGLYAPGSTFKLVTAVAALRRGHHEPHVPFICVRLPDGRVGGRVPGAAAPIRDDPRDKAPHGTLDLHRALVVSCNGYFAHLAGRIGPEALADAAAAAGIAAAPPPVGTNLRRTLPHAGYGQGDVVASPLRMARATAALASDGLLRDVRVTRERSGTSADVRWIDGDGAAQLRRDMRRVVTAGSGRVLAGHRVPIAGKTGTAEVDGQRSHSWFVGFAPYADQPARIAFAVIVENAGYGGRVAAPIAGEIVTAAAARGLLESK